MLRPDLDAPGPAHSSWQREADLRRPGPWVGNLVVCESVEAFLDRHGTKKWSWPLGVAPTTAPSWKPFLCKVQVHNVGPGRFPVFFFFSSFFFYVVTSSVVVTVIGHRNR